MAVRGIKMPGFINGLMKKKGGKSTETKKDSSVKCISIYRYNPDKCDPPYMQQYKIDIKDFRGVMVLDILIYIKNEIDPTLIFRRSCREGVCGSCAMNINGKNGLACIKQIGPGDLTIYPLPHLYVIKDLVCDLSNFYRQHRDIQPWLQKKDEDKFRTGESQLLQSERDREKIDSAVNCILCACCSTACPSYWWNGNAEDRFLGPAAMLNAFRWILDSRDEKHCERLDRLKSLYNIYRCHTIFNCTNTCPKHLNPGMSIAKLKMLCGGFANKEPPDLANLKTSV